MRTSKFKIRKTDIEIDIEQFLRIRNWNRNRYRQSGIRNQNRTSKSNIEDGHRKPNIENRKTKVETYIEYNKSEIAIEIENQHRNRTSNIKTIIENSKSKSKIKSEIKLVTIITIWNWRLAVGLVSYQTNWNRAPKLKMQIKNDFIEIAFEIENQTRIEHHNRNQIEITSKTDTEHRT